MRRCTGTRFDACVVPKLLDEIAAFIKSVQKRVAHDSWFGPDKLKHFFISAFIESVAFSGLQASGASRSAAFAGAIATVAAFALGREVHDKRTKGIFSIPDLTWDAAGGGARAIDAEVHTLPITKHPGSKFIRIRRIIRIVSEPASRQANRDSARLFFVCKKQKRSARRGQEHTPVRLNQDNPPNPWNLRALMPEWRGRS